MNRIVRKYLLALIVLCAGGWVTMSQAGDAAIASAETATRAWLALTDSGSYAESWAGGSSLFRNAVTESQWTQALQSARAPLGDLKDRELTLSKYATSLPGAPDGEYVVFQFSSRFANRAATETVTAMKDTDGSWRVSGYFVR